jgi:alpha-1,6-mannosyltransferase
MRICDVTLAYAPTSGGIRTYIDAKRQYLLEHTDHEHVLIVPGEDDAVEQDGRAITYRLASPVFPGHAPYRFFWRPGKIKQALLDSGPEVVELGSFYVCPWAAFSYRRERRADGRPCAVGGYFHTDVAEAYFGQPLREAFGQWSETLNWLGDRLADATRAGVEAYMQSVFEKCDLLMAASPAQAERLRQYGVDEVTVVPLGVDLNRFAPERRSEEVRATLHASPEDIVLIYGGRLDVEKHVDVLVEALKRLPERFPAKLILIGQGPLGEELLKKAAVEPRLEVLPYESDPGRFAALLASSDIYVTAGPHETFGLSVVEAQACGLPVVGVAAGALVERVPEDAGLLGPVGDAAAFAENVRKVSQRRDELGTNARRIVEESFGWDSTFRDLLSLYDGALRQSGQNPAPTD